MGQHDDIESMTADQAQWIARLTSSPGSNVHDLLQLPLGLDVWERHPHQLVVAATDDQLREIERRRLAQVDRVETVAAFLARQRGQTEP
jgi:hypothetical protein